MEKTIGDYEQELAISRKNDDRWSEGIVLGNLGVMYDFTAKR